MKPELKSVHVGETIAKRIKELKISKSEFGRRIGVPQQHVNRILQRETMETAKLVKVCHAIDYNIFSLFCPMQHTIYEYVNSLSEAEGVEGFNNEGSLTDNLKKKETDLKEKEDTISRLKEKIASKDEMIEQLNLRIAELKGRLGNLESNLKDKDVIIGLIQEKQQPR